MQAEIVQMKDWANKSKNQKVFYFLLDEKLRWCRLIDELEKLKDQQDNTMSVRVRLMRKQDLEITLEQSKITTV